MHASSVVARLLEAAPTLPEDEPVDGVIDQLLNADDAAFRALGMRPALSDELNDPVLGRKRTEGWVLDGENQRIEVYKIQVGTGRNDDDKPVYSNDYLIKAYVTGHRMTGETTHQRAPVYSAQCRARPEAVKKVKQVKARDFSTHKQLLTLGFGGYFGDWSDSLMNVRVAQNGECSLRMELTGLTPEMLLKWVEHIRQDADSRL